MSEWGWVAVGYGVMYGALAAYAGSLALRVSRARRRLDELS